LLAASHNPTYNTHAKDDLGRDIVEL